MLDSGVASAVAISQSCCAGIVAACLLCAMPAQHRFTSARLHRRGDSANFFGLLCLGSDDVIGCKLTCLGHYLLQSVRLLEAGPSDSSVVFVRGNAQVVAPFLQLPSVHEFSVRIEPRRPIPDFEGCSILADFANRDFGGGAAANGMVQEEIMLAERPDAYVGMALFDRCGENEAVAVVGARQFIHTQGYASSSRFHSVVSRSDCPRRCALKLGAETRSVAVVDTCITALDARHYRKAASPADLLAQLRDSTREITKVEVACAILQPAFLVSLPPSAVFAHATHAGPDLPEFTRLSLTGGNWGCGAFNGFHPAKYLAQALGARDAGFTSLTLCTFGQPTAKVFGLPFQHLWSRISGYSTENIVRLWLEAAHELDPEPNASIAELAADLYSVLFDLCDLRDAPSEMLSL
jgi:hypothetical protein